VKKWATIFGVAGALWMILVLRSGSLALAAVSNYPGSFAARWVQYRGIAPSPVLIRAFNVWVVFSSAIAWVAVGLTCEPSRDACRSEAILNWRSRAP